MSISNYYVYSNYPIISQLDNLKLGIFIVSRGSVNEDIYYNITEEMIDLHRVRNYILYQAKECQHDFN